MAAGINIKNMYNELLFTSIALNFFDSFLTFVAVLAIGYLLSYFYRFSIFIPLAAAIIFFARSIFFKIRQNKILFLEKKYPQLKERLRTSYDYQERNNTVINDLHSDILEMIKNVDINAFLNSKVLLAKTGIIFLMLLSVLVMSSYGFDSYDIKRAIVNTPFFKGASSAISDLFDGMKEEVKNRPLLDKPEIKDSGDRDVNISIDTYNTELDINDIDNPEKNDFGGSYPQEIAGEAQQVYEEEIPEEYKDAVKEYFKKINK